MKCMICGTANRDGARHCKGCGARLTRSPDDLASKTPVPTTLDPAVAQAIREDVPLTWDDGADRKRKRTRVADPAELLEAGKVSAGRPAFPDGSARPPGRNRRTVYAPGGGLDDAGVPAPSGRIFGFLVTYTWNPSGDWIVLREGKNTVGAEPGLDGSFEADQGMSGRHFSVMYRRGAVRIRDLDTTNATMVNGEEVWGESVGAKHGAIIRAGNTTFELVLVPSLTGG